MQNGRSCASSATVTRQTALWQSGTAVRHTIETMDALALWTPRILMFVGWLAPVAVGLHGDLRYAILLGIVMAICISVLIHSLDRTVIGPMRRLRFAQAAVNLETGLRAAAPASSIIHRWSQPYPGVLAMTTERHLILVDSSTGYQLVRFGGEDMIDVTVTLSSTPQPNNRPAIRSRVGAARLQSGAPCFGRVSRPTARALDTTVLELRYRHRRGAPVIATLIEFGLDRTAAETLRSTLIDIRKTFSATPDPRQERFLP